MIWVHYMRLQMALSSLLPSQQWQGRQEQGQGQRRQIEGHPKRFWQGLQGQVVWQAAKLWEVQRQGIMVALERLPWLCRVRLLRQDPLEELWRDHRHRHAAQGQDGSLPA